MDALSETYDDIEETLLQICKSFKRSNYQFDLDELMSEARWFFLIAYHNYDPEQGSFSNWVWQKVTGGLKEYRENWYTRYKRCALKDLGKQPESNISSLEKLSDDANKIIRLILRNQKKMLKNSKPQLLLVKHLRKLDWSYGRINMAFNEIKEAI